MSTDAIVLLKDDHKEIRRLFKEFQNAGDNATATKGKTVDAIIKALTVHTYIENECMYPEVRKLLPTWTRTSSSPTRNITPPTSCARNSPR